MKHTQAYESSTDLGEDGPAAPGAADLWAHP